MIADQNRTGHGSDEQDTDEPTQSRTDGPIGYRESLRQVLHVALPLMVSTGTFSIVLFIDRTLLLGYGDGTAMTASMAAGNLFWTLLCIPIGIMSMSGAFVAQFIGDGQDRMVGRFLWQTVWLSLLTLIPSGIFAVLAWSMLRGLGQPESLLAEETIYMQTLMLGGAGVVLENALGGYFSGTHRTITIMLVSLASAVVNLGLDVLLIFGPGPFPEMGIAGAGIATSMAFWFKGVVFAWFIWFAKDRDRYGVRDGICVDLALIRRLLFFGMPAGLQFVAEAGGFSLILLAIGALGDVPLRATTMAINFNQIAFIPLVGVSIAASVLVGQHLTNQPPVAFKTDGHRLPKHPAVTTTIASLLIVLLYCGTWALAYLFFAEPLIQVYTAVNDNPDSLLAANTAVPLLWFVALFLVIDGVQLVVGGGLRGAGDTWYVLASTAIVSFSALAIGYCFQPDPQLQKVTVQQALHWWWWVLTGWVVGLTTMMVGRFIQGRWLFIQMIDLTGGETNTEEQATMGTGKSPESSQAREETH